MNRVLKSNLTARLRELADLLERHTLPEWIGNRIAARLASEFRIVDELKERGARPDVLLCRACLKDDKLTEFNDLHELLRHGRDDHGIGQDAHLGDLARKVSPDPNAPPAAEHERLEFV